LPALFISLGMGIKLGAISVKKYFKIKNEYLQSGFIFISTLLIGILGASIYVMIPKVFGFIVFAILIAFVYFALRNVEMKKALSLSLKTFVAVILPLLVIAAIIEGLLIVLTKA